MLRIVSLTMILLLSTGVMLPFAGSSAHGLRQNLISKRYHNKRHSRAWWRRHRARLARLRMKRREAAMLASMAHRKTVLTPVLPLQMTKGAPAQAAIPVPELVFATIPGMVSAPAPLTVPVPARTAASSVILPRASRKVPVPATVPVMVPVSVATVVSVVIPPAARKVPVPPTVPVKSSASVTKVASVVLPPASREVPIPATAPVPSSASRMLSAPVVLAVPAPPLKSIATPASRTITAPLVKTVKIPVAVPAPDSKATLSATSKPVANAVSATIPAPAAGPQLPVGWNPLASKTGEVRFRTETAAGAVSGQAALDVVAQSRPNPVYMSAREERRLLAGVAIGDLRRIVIDKMIADGGWVINDYFHDVAGQRVFIVSAQTPGDGRSPDKSWNFYFTEVNGRIYRLTTNTPQQFSDRMAAEAESFIASFHAISKPASK